MQAVVGRAGWAQGNALALAVPGHRPPDRRGVRGRRQLAPLLHVEYTTGSGGPSNTPPVVNAGADQTITLPANASLDGTVTDDGLPNLPGALTSTWTRTTGPGTVTFANANAVDTTASFSAAGTYMLRLTANDGALTAQDDVTVTVNPATPATPHRWSTPDPTRRSPCPPPRPWTAPSPTTASPHPPLVDQHLVAGLRSRHRHLRATPPRSTPPRPSPRPAPTCCS